MICKKINFRRELLGQPACRGHSKATEAKVQVGPLTARLVADLTIVHVMLVLRHREHRDNELVEVPDEISKQSLGRQGQDSCKLFALGRMQSEALKVKSKLQKRPQDVTASRAVDVLRKAAGSKHNQPRRENAGVAANRT